MADTTPAQHEPSLGPELDALVASGAPPGLIGKLGIQFTEVSAARVVATMPVAGNTQPRGLLHGGATAALAETAGSVAAMAHAGAGRAAVGLDLSITHHRSAREGEVTAVATPLHLGRSTTSHHIQVVDASGRVVASGRLTCVLLDQGTEG